MSDTVVQRLVVEPSPQRILLILRDGSCLAITANLVTYARDVAALHDPLANGVRAVLEIPTALLPKWMPAQGYVQEQSGGAVLLHGGTTLLIKPYAIELYAAPMDALHARNCCGRIDLTT